MDPIVDYLDPLAGFILATVLWAFLAYLAFKDKLKRKIDDHFAQRRHNRRMRNRMPQPQPIRHAARK